MNEELQYLKELIDALCIIIKGWSTDNEKILFDSASQVITKRAEYLQLLEDKKIIENKLQTYNQKKS